MAIRFKLPDGANTDIVSISAANGFPVATPEDFLALLTAISKSGRAWQSTPVEQFLGAHPAALNGLRPAPTATELRNTRVLWRQRVKSRIQSVSHYARYQILPVAGEHALTAAEVAKVDRTT